MKNIFLQAYYHGNLGDDLFIKILCERYPDIMFNMIVSGNNKNKIEGLPNLKLIPRHWTFRIRNKLSQTVMKKTMASRIAAKSDCAVLLGGSMFMEMNENKWKRILASYKDISSSVTHFFVMGANFGPYHSEEFLRAYHDFF